MTRSKSASVTFRAGALACLWGRQARCPAWPSRRLAGTRSLSSRRPRPNHGPEKWGSFGAAWDAHFWDFCRVARRLTQPWRQVSVMMRGRGAVMVFCPFSQVAPHPQPSVARGRDQSGKTSSPGHEGQVSLASSRCRAVPDLTVPPTASHEVPNGDAQLRSRSAAVRRDQPVRAQSSRRIPGIQFSAVAPPITQRHRRHGSKGAISAFCAAGGSPA